MERTAWLIEHPDNKAGIRYAEMAGGDWTPNIDKAAQFARRQDAEEYWRAFGDDEIDARVVEHTWQDAKVGG